VALGLDIQLENPDAGTNWLGPVARFAVGDVLAQSGKTGAVRNTSYPVLDNRPPPPPKKRRFGWFDVGILKAENYFESQIQCCFGVLEVEAIALES